MNIEYPTGNALQTALPGPDGEQRSKGDSDTPRADHQVSALLPGQPWLRRGGLLCNSRYPGYGLLHQN